jgi:peptidyl-prolyl cis-trans isomerase D
MAEQEKRDIKSIVMRVVVAVMFGMLILSFAIWGIGDIFRRGMRTTSVAEVGGERIMPPEFQDQYRRELRRIQGLLNTDITADKARALGLPQRVLATLINRVLFDLAARDAGVAVSTEVVRQSIMDNPAFHNAEGNFDRTIFSNVMQNAGYTEERFVALTRQDIVRSQVTEAVGAGSAVPATLADALYRYRNEKRTAEAVLIPSASIKDVPSPSDADLEAYHKAHSEAFTAPEYRAVTVVELEPEDLAAQVKVPEEKLKDEYEARISEFKVPEQRTLRQIIVKDEDTAKQAEQRLAQGESFDKIADALTGKPPLDLGTVSSDEMPSPDLAAATFALKENDISKPVQTPLGWHIVQVLKIIPVHTQGFDEAKDKLARQLALNDAGEVMYDLGNKLQDALGGGASLEDAAKKLNLKIVKLEAIDNQGLAPDRKPAANLPKSPKILSTAFSAEAGRDSELTEDGLGGYFILRVDKVTPSQLRPLAEVRDKVIAGWQQDARQKAAEKLAAALKEEASTGANLAELARTHGYTYTTTAPFTRTGNGASLPPDVVASLFAAKVGGIAIGSGADGAVVARLSSVVAADPKTDNAGMKQLDERLRSTIDADVINAFAGALRNRYGVEVNESIVSTLIGS